MLKHRNKQKSDSETHRRSFKMSLRDWRQALYSTSLSSGYRISNGAVRFQTKFVWLITTLGLASLIYIYKGNNGTMTTPNDSKTRFIGYGDVAYEYNRTYPLTSPRTVSNGIEYQIALIADMDKNSKSDSHKNTWISYLLRGTLTWNGDDKYVAVHINESPIVLKSSYCLAGRGMELSELAVFDGRLLTFDDRTGIVYEIKANEVVPWLILTDGDGNINKGFKSEWATVKKEHLYVGSMGKEWTSEKGVFINHNPMWIKIIHPSGHVKHVDWQSNYKRIRQTVDIDFPGYMIHEAGVWSAIHRKWFFLPRRSSRSAYDEVTDEYRGTNLLLIADENFDSVIAKRVGNIVPTRGFSSFKFIPATNDNVIAALKSEEINGTLATYVTVFTIDGSILLADTKVADLKYEGFEFV